MYDNKITQMRIKQLCKDKGVSERKMLASIGLGTNAVRQISAKNGMMSASLMKIADYFDCSVDFLLGRDKQ